MENRQFNKDMSSLSEHDISKILNEILVRLGNIENRINNLEEMISRQQYAIQPHYEFNPIKPPFLGISLSELIRDPKYRDNTNQGNYVDFESSPK